jgi:hypothetical protein
LRTGPNLLKLYVVEKYIFWWDLGGRLRGVVEPPGFRLVSVKIYSVTERLLRLLKLSNKALDYQPQFSRV